MGSGNDYIRTFGSQERFLQVEAQMKAQPVKVDMIQTEKMLSLNLCSAGLDAAVALHMAKFKKLPLVSGPMAITWPGKMRARQNGKRSEGNHRRPSAHSGPVFIRPGGKRAVLRRRLLRRSGGGSLRRPAGLCLDPQVGSSVWQSYCPSIRKESICGPVPFRIF